jgi:hypothetical protein
MGSVGSSGADETWEDGSESSFPSSASTGITKEALIGKIAFLRFGPKPGARMEDLKKELQAFHREGNYKLTRQAIDKWFGDAKGVPSGSESLKMLKAYVEGRPRSELNPAQKHVLRSLQAYFKIHNPIATQRRIRTSPQGTFQMNVGARVMDMIKDVSAITGTYVTFKMRFTENAGEPIAREVLHIFVEGPDLRFEHWYMRQDEKISRFEGSIFPTLTMLWFFGFSERVPDRFRIMSLRRNDEDGTIRERYRWGIVHSDVPLADSHVPAACRILLTPAPELGAADVRAFAEETVRYLKEDDLPSDNRPIIKRLLDNHLTSLSDPSTYEPVRKKGRGGPMVDAVLKVDQTTMRVATDQWKGKPDRRNPR